MGELRRRGKTTDHQRNTVSLEQQELMMLMLTTMTCLDLRLLPMVILMKMTQMMMTSSVTMMRKMQKPKKLERNASKPTPTKKLRSLAQLPNPTSSLMSNLGMTPPTWAMLKASSEPSKPMDSFGVPPNLLPLGMVSKNFKSDVL